MKFEEVYYFIKILICNKNPINLKKIVTMTQTSNVSQKMNLKENRMIKLLEETPIKQVLHQKNRKPVEVSQNTSVYDALKVCILKELQY